jgi:ABC-type multidrug transport system fused ATPase/permease subunit
MDTQKEKNYSPVKTLRRLLQLSRKYILWLALLCIAAVLRSSLGVLDTEGFRRMINGATQADLNLVKSGIVLGVIALTAGLVLDFILDYYGEILNFITTRELQSRLVKKVTKVQMIKYEAYHSGDLIDRLDNCASMAQTGLNTNTRTILESVLMIVFSMIYLTVLNFELMVSTLIFMLLLPLLVTPLSKALRDVWDKRQKLRVDKDSLVQDAFQGGEVVRGFSLSKRLYNKYLERFNKFLQTVKRTLVFEGFMFNVHFMIILGGDFFILGLGGYMVHRGRMDVGSVISFLLMFERIMQPISRLASIWPQFQSSISSAHKIFEILDLPEEQWSSNKSSVETLNISEGAEIHVENISFSYSDESKILKGLNFICEAGKVTALAGPSGAGKSTVLKLLLRLYEPNSGEVWCNGIPICSVTPERWRRSTAYVSQDPLLFSGTILENISYGNEGISDGEVERAAREANIHDLIMSMPEGYQSKIGEQGIRLSGGERQRISIARAILRDPKILILDEPTSALDSENERLIQEALNKLMKGRTTVIVAHRLSTIQNADKIIFIEDGEAREQGSHRELMALKGKYHDMHEKIKRTSELGVSAESIEEVAI